MRVVVCNLGCKVNQYESDSMMLQLAELGYDVGAELSDADAYIVNTCAVTNEAECKSRQTIARCLKYNQNAVIIVCGCASQNDHTAFESKSGVTYISGVAGKSSIPDMLLERGIHVAELPTVYEDNMAVVLNRTRAYVKVQDGCNNYCSYCIIPYLRGRNRSRSVSSVVAECNRLAQHTQEIVLTGINLSAYGIDINSSLVELISNLEHLNIRIRLGSLEVNVISDSLLNACKRLKKFCPQFHLSLQSGSDGVLHSMNRHYTTDDYYNNVELIRSHYPDAAITTDVICGFPTESDHQFAETLAFVSKVRFADMHIFAYSKREGTVAARYKQLPATLVRARCRELESVRDISRAEYAESLKGRELEVLVEGSSGYSLEYIRFDNIVGYKCGDIIKIVL